MSGPGSGDEVWAGIDAQTRETLERRFGLHARRRLAIEREHETRVLGRRLGFVPIGHLHLLERFISATVWASALQGRGRRNAASIVVRENLIRSPRITATFDGFRILHITDLHADISGEAVDCLGGLVGGLAYDLCVLTGDYRGATFGSPQAAMAGMAHMVARLEPPIYAVLGNHDSIVMVPDLEKMGARVLLNASTAIERAGQSIHVAGIDDAHFYKLHDMETAASGISRSGFSILLSHTPEIYRDAAAAGFDLMLCGHTHGGQICLPGGLPVTLQCPVPRSFGAGAWKFHELNGYTSTGVGTSLLPVRFNCPPEITMHELRRGSAARQHIPS